MNATDGEIRDALIRVQDDALRRGDHLALYRAAGVSQDWARRFLDRDHVLRFLRRVQAGGYDEKRARTSVLITDEMVTAARDELIARINNKIQPTRGTVRAALEAALMEVSE